MTCSNDFFLPIPDQAVEWQEAGGDIQHRPRGLLRCTWVNNRNAAVVASESQRVSTRRKANSMDPARGVIQELPTDSVKWETLTPSTRFWARINALNVTRENSGVGVRGSGGE